MDTAQKSLLVVCICVLCDYNILATRGNGKPEILSDFETILEVNSNHTVSCRGNRPLKWTMPEVNKDRWTTFSTESEKPVNRSYQYGSRLEITNMTYNFIGFYYCGYADNLQDNASIYLYISDPDHLTLLKLNSIVNDVIVTETQQAVLPCRPTSSDVQVTLHDITDGNEVPLDVRIQHGFSYHFNPLYGFLTNNTKQYQKLFFECVFKRDKKTQKAIVQLTVEKLVNELAEPSLRDLNEGHTVFGQNLTLECRIMVTADNDVHFHWNTPTSMKKHRMKFSKQKINNEMLETLTIHDATKSDNGTYSCNVTDNQHHSSYKSLNVKIFDINEHFLIVKKENNYYITTASVGESSVQWNVTVKGHPRPSVQWLDNKNETIPLGNGTKYKAYYNSSENKVYLRIKNIEINDFGYYTLVVINKRSERKTFFFNVTAKPTVVLDVETFHLIGTPSTVKCSTEANPEPEFQWYLKPCLSTACSYIPINGSTSKNKGIQFVSEITVNLTESGFLKCFAKNYIGNSSATKKFYVSDIKNGFGLVSLDNTVNIDEQKKEATIAENDTVTIICGASSQVYSDVLWFFNKKPLTSNDKYRLTNHTTQYSSKLELQIQHANIFDSGLYSCRVTNKNGTYLYQNMTVKVASPEAPKILNTTLQDKIEMNLPEPLRLYCKVSGIPKPVLKWYKNGNIFSTTEYETKRVHVSKSNEQILFLQTIAQDEGTYKCEARNRIGSTIKRQTVTFKNRPDSITQDWILAVMILLSLLCIGTTIYIFVRIRKEKQIKRELTLLGLSNFEKGAVENINPELGIDEQAEHLPYDQKWEFPTENLKIGKQLGSGAFGVVMKGVARNIVEGEDETTVAIKMVKKNADNTYIKALASELKIMVHLGKHLNVVNLLGACTKNVAKRELLVIVEFCRFGNLQNYLLRHRNKFIDQIDPRTGKIDYMIGLEFFDRTYSVSDNKSSNTQSPLVISDSDIHPVTDMAAIIQGEDGMGTSNNSTQPEWRSNYKGDYKGNVKPICTKDLLTWGFQVARGMQYLASRKVLHGDLAARNILLADNNVVKICDFGLAKNMYNDDNYKKQGKCLLPLKWMAIESIRDRIFSTQSDVWSFGIVLWEFFSLARNPYPGIEADERLYQKLEEGYRMEPPQFAPTEVYKMMTECWSPTPGVRPSFENLARRLGGLLDNSTQKHYINLNDPYLAMNTQSFKSGQSDYLSMLSPPTFEILSSPHYVNGNGQHSLGDSDYLSMKSSVTFSPRDDSVFDFNMKNRQSLNPAEGNAMELLPMLPKASHSCCDTPLHSPITPNSFSNPSYHLTPNVTAEAEGYSINGEVVKSSENFAPKQVNKNLEGVKM